MRPFNAIKDLMIWYPENCYYSKTYNITFNCGYKSYSLSNNSDCVKLVGKSGISTDKVIIVIANANIASLKDTKCSSFIDGINDPDDILENPLFVR